MATLHVLATLQFGRQTAAHDGSIVEFSFFKQNLQVASLENTMQK